MTGVSMALGSHVVRTCMTRNASRIQFDGSLVLSFERRRDRHSIARIMSNARPALAINSSTAIFGSTGSPHSHEVVGQQIIIQEVGTRLGRSLAGDDFSEAIRWVSRTVEAFGLGGAVNGCPSEASVASQRRRRRDRKRTGEEEGQPFAAV